MLSFHLLYRANYLKIKDIFASSEVQVFFQHPPPLSFFGRRKAPPEVTRNGTGLFVLVTDPRGGFILFWQADWLHYVQPVLYAAKFSSVLKKRVQRERCSRNLQNEASREQCTDAQKHIKQF